MNIAISGKTGFLGSALSKHLDNKHVLLEISRDILDGDKQKLIDIVEKSDVIINLAGSSIFKRWTKKNKKEIYDSRIISTSKIRDAIFLAEKKPSLFISVSAISIYDSFHTHYDGSIKFSTGFIPNLLKEWEQQANNVSLLGVRTIIARLGIVLGDGGFLKVIKPILSKKVIIAFGDRSSVISFIHINDLIRIFEFFINNEESRGIYNISAPHKVYNKKMFEHIASYSGNQFLIRIPMFFISLIKGKSPKMLMKSCNVKPSKLLKEGFEFEYKKIKKILNNLL